MAQIVVRNIPDELFDRFKKRAKTEGKSAEQLARETIASAALVEPVAYWMKEEPKSGGEVASKPDKMPKTSTTQSPRKQAKPKPMGNDWQKDSLW